MSRTKDITGERFGRLVVVGQKGRASDRHILWECRCDYNMGYNQGYRDELKESVERIVEYVEDEIKDEGGDTE